jgi:Fe-S-cluster containining protein
MKLKFLLPQLYTAILPPELLALSIEEKKATCDQCAMVVGRHRGAITYAENLKCCTYYPFMPNYLIGASLQDSSLQPSLQRDLRGIISRRRYSLPIGFLAPVRYQMEFNNRKPSDFGQRADWLCPYYDKSSNNCGIWRYRSAVCTTFYCKTSYGSGPNSAGLRFWFELSEYLTYVEMALLEEALIRLDFSPRQISDQLDYLNRKTASAAEEKSWILPEKKARFLWNGYFDEQELFFKKTLEIVTKFDRKDFNEALGDLGLKILDRVTVQARRLKTS